MMLLIVIIILILLLGGGGGYYGYGRWGYGERRRRRFRDHPDHCSHRVFTRWFLRTFVVSTTTALQKASLWPVRRYRQPHL